MLNEEDIKIDSEQSNSEVQDVKLVEDTQIEAETVSPEESKVKVELKKDEKTYTSAQVEKMMQKRLKNASEEKKTSDERIANLEKLAENEAAKRDIEDKLKVKAKEELITKSIASKTKADFVEQITILMNNEDLKDLTPEEIEIKIDETISKMPGVAKDEGTSSVSTSINKIPEVKIESANTGTTETSGQYEFNGAIISEADFNKMLPEYQRKAIKK